MGADFIGHQKMDSAPRVDQPEIIAIAMACAFSGFFFGVILVACLWWVWP